MGIKDKFAKYSIFIQATIALLSGLALIVILFFSSGLLEQQQKERQKQHSKIRYHRKDYKNQSLIIKEENGLDVEYQIVPKNQADEIYAEKLESIRQVKNKASIMSEKERLRAIKQLQSSIEDNAPLLDPIVQPTSKSKK